MRSSRKRKASSCESEEGSGKIEQMEIIFAQIRTQINDLNKQLLTIADTRSFSLLKPNLNAGEINLSWRIKRSDLISGDVIQMQDDCWAHAFSQGLYAVMKQLGNTENLPTAMYLVTHIDRKFLTEFNALPKPINAASLLLHHYGYDMVVHHRPKLESFKETEDFEKFIERRLAIGLVVVRFPYVPSYSHFSHKNKAVFRPSVIDIQAMHNESLDNHYVVITGRGVVLLSGGESIEFWEIHETRGRRFGDEGFTRLERHKGLITEIYEFRPMSFPMQTTDDKHMEKNKDKVIDASLHSTNWNLFSMNSDTNPMKKAKVKVTMST